MILFKFHTALLATLVLISSFYENNALISRITRLNLKLMWDSMKEKVVGGAEPVYTQPTIDDMVMTWKSFLAALGYAGTLSTDKLKAILSEKPAPVGFGEAPPQRNKPKEKSNKNPKSKGGCVPNMKSSCANNKKQTAESKPEFDGNVDNLKIIMQALLVKEKEAFNETSNNEKSRNLTIEENQGELKSLFHYCARKNSLVGEDRDDLYNFCNPSDEYPLTTEQKCTLACMLKETGMVDPETGRALQNRTQFNNAWLLLETASSFAQDLFTDYQGQDMAYSFFYKARALADNCLLIRIGDDEDKCDVANRYYRSVRSRDYSKQFSIMQSVWMSARSTFNTKMAKKEQETKRKQEEAKKKQKEAKKREEEEAKKKEGEANKNQQKETAKLKNVNISD